MEGVGRTDQNQAALATADSFYNQQSQQGAASTTPWANNPNYWSGGASPNLALNNVQGGTPGQAQQMGQASAQAAPTQPGRCYGGGTEGLMRHYQNWRLGVR